MEKLLTLCEFIKLELPTEGTNVRHILEYMVNEWDSNVQVIAKAIIDAASKYSEDTPIEQVIESVFGDCADLTCDLCGHRLGEGLWENGRHIECSSELASIEASGHGDFTGDPESADGN